MKNDIVISIKNLSKYYKLYKTPRDRLKEALSITGKRYHKKFYATDNVNLEIKKGEILGIVGKNGSGKSTLLKLISKVLTPSKGSIKVRGEVTALLELGSGFNPQFTGMENIYFYGSVLGFTTKEMDGKVDDIVAFADIGEFINQPIKTYSSGMKARLGFAVATNIEPDILIIDEVLSVGDVLFKRKSYAKMQAFFESGKTIIFVSHNTNEINRICTRAVFLLDGKIIMDGDPKSVTQYYEKHLFAKDRNREEVIEEIRKIGLSRGVPNSTKSQHISEKLGHDVKRKPLDKTKTCIQSGAFFVKDFITKNSNEYDNSYLDIDNIFIKTLDGEVVNHLQRHVRYRYCYTLNFKDSFSSVGFGMQIHTEKGVVISSCGARQCEPEEMIRNVKAGDVFDIEWEFNCLLRHGIYYTNTGVVHMLNGQHVFINRITDSYVFKVLPQKDCTGGLVSLQQSKPNVTHVNSQ